MIPYGSQKCMRSDIYIVKDILTAYFLTKELLVSRFETGLKKIINGMHALAINSEAPPAHVTCFSLGNGPEDRPWQSPNTAAVSCPDFDAVRRSDCDSCGHFEELT